MCKGPKCAAFVNEDLMLRIGIVQLRDGVHTVFALKIRHSNFSSGTMNRYFLTLMLTNAWRSNFRHFTLIFVIDQKQSNHLSQRALFLDFVNSASISVC